jgi:8-oxo-dGTP pyrophosphatase MutT (NUDIX family)
MNSTEERPQHRPRQKQIQCINCGFFGHTAKKCNEPTSSYGIICYRVLPNRQIQFLMVQRKDSLSYIEFMRGRYDLANKDYLQKLFDNMTLCEKMALMKCPSFDVIWKELWNYDEEYISRFERNYLDSIDKFNALRAGINLKDKDGNLHFVSINSLACSSTTHYCDTDWEFPKGRRMINEGNLSCARREFEEETGLSSSSIVILNEYKPIEEIFVGMNRSRYRNVYYLACLINHFNPMGENNPSSQFYEVKNINWFSLEEVIQKTRNTERKELIRRVSRMLLKEIKN